MLRILQVNLQHSKAASAALCQQFLRDNIDLALIQEPWLCKGGVAGLGEAKGELVYDTSLSDTRTCILVRKGIKSLPLTNFCSRDITTVKIEQCIDGTNGDLILSSIYLPYDATEPPPSRGLDHLVEKLQGGQHLLVGADANAHHEAWGSTNTNFRGESLLSYLISKELYILNNGNKPTFRNRIREEVLDITFSTGAICSLVENWHVSSEPSLSDHAYIRFQIRKRNNESLSIFRNPRKTDWYEYSADLGAMLSKPVRVKSIIDIDQAASQLQEAILDSYHNNCPLQLRQKHQQTRWWSIDLEKKRKKVRSKFNKCKRSGDWLEYRETLAEYKSAIRTAKRNSWKAFCQDISSQTETARLQKVMVNLRHHPVGTLEKPTGGYTATSLETLDLLLRIHFPGCIVREQNDGGFQNAAVNPWPRATAADWRTARSVITVASIKRAINKFSPFKAPGGDMIFPALLQKGPESLYQQLCAIFRASLAYGYIPQSWRVSRVVFIPKRGRANYTNAKAYRPISLASFMLKTMERLIDRHIRRRVLSDTPLHRNQHAYQPGKSCETAIHQLVSRLEDSLDRREIALGAFLDIEGAFDNTSFASMISSARNRGLESTACRWIDSMLRSRRIQSQLAGSSREVEATRGCPQGGVLSPILWSLVVDDLLQKLTKQGYYCQGYADDIALVVFGKFPQIITDLMNSGLKLINDWCGKEGLQVNSSKTVVVPFTRKRVQGEFNSLRLNGERVNISESVKYLGITLDNKLTWNQHLKNVIHKARWSFLAARRFVGLTWGLKPHMAYWLYTAVIRPQVAYGALVWWPKAQQTTSIRKLSSLQRLACVCITGAFRSAPTATLEILLGLPPLNIYLKSEARMAAYRLTNTGNWRRSIRSVGHSLITEKVLKGTVLDMISDSMQAVSLENKALSFVLGSRRDWNKSQLPARNANQIIFYTDGSRVGSHSGFGVYCPAPRIEIFGSLGQHCTVFQAEIYAILMCALKGLEKGFSNKHILILSDSQAAIMALDSDQTTSQLVWNCHQLLNKLALQNSIELRWVPGHLGIWGNEKADNLAKKGSMTPFIGPEPVCGISRSTARMAIKNWASETQHRLWYQLPGQRLGKLLVKKSSSVLTKSLIHMSREQLRTVTGLITGHGHVLKHLKTVGIRQGDVSCRLCGKSEETARHIILDCEALEARRIRLFNSTPGTYADPGIGRGVLALVKGTELGRQC